MKPRICLVVQHDYMSDGRLRRYAEALADHGAQVDVLCVHGDEEETAPYRDDIRLYRIPMRHGAKSLLGYLVEYSLAMFFFSLWLIPLQIRRRYQVVHIHNMPDFLIFCGLFPRLLGARLVLDIHDAMPEFYLSKFDSSKKGWLFKFLRLQERLSAWFANAVIAANENFKQNMVERGTPESKITVVNNFADVNIFDRNKHPRSSSDDNQSADQPFTLLYPGTLAPRYGLDLPIRAAVQLRGEIPNLLIRIVGPHNSYADELQQLAAELDVQQNVEILPCVPVTEVARLMSQADLGFYPALPGPHMSIATPSKVLEFVQMGLPVVASRLLVLEQFFDDDSIRFYPPGDVQQFSEAVRQLWASPELRAAQVAHADQQHVRHRTWQKEQDKYFRLLDQLLKTSSLAGPAASTAAPQQDLATSQNAASQDAPAQDAPAQPLA